jgi:hypothetical protein
MPMNLANCICRGAYVFENGTPFYERLGDERAAALLKALSAEGYRITPAGNVSTESEHRTTR